MRAFEARYRLITCAGLFLLLALIMISTAFVYVSSEHTFYYWDYAGYQNITHRVAVAFRESPLGAMRMVEQSIATNYNGLFALPLVPFMLAFGDSRLVYVLSLTMVYLLPYVLSIGAIAAKLIPIHPRRVFCTAVVLALLTPALWAPTLRGYPDTGGALLIALGILVYLVDIELKRWWQAPLIGFLLAAATLFRRHFAYGAIAFLVAIALKAVVSFALQLRLRPRPAVRQLLKSGARVGLAGVTSLITLAVLGRPFVEHVLARDFGELYASYVRTVAQNCLYYASVYGWGTCVLAGLGFAVAGISNALPRAPVLFIALLGTVSLVQWFFEVGQCATHYSLHFTLLVVLGLTTLIWLAWTRLRGSLRALLIGACSCYLVLNALVGLTPSSILDTVCIQPFFSVRYDPLVRPDYDKLVQLVSYLRTVASPEDPIYVAASSPVLSADLIVNAERALYGYDGALMNMVGVPSVDSRDYYPLENLLRARYVLVATPFQHHLPITEQGVVKVVFDAFTENWDIAGDFTRVPIEFHLTEGVIVDLYERARPTPVGTAVRTLSEIQIRTGQRPGGQRDWIVVSQGSASSIMENADTTYRVSTYPSEKGTPQSATFLYLGIMPEQMKILGNLRFSDDRCAGALVRVAGVDAQGSVLDSAQVALRPSDPPGLSLSLQGHQAAYVLLELLATDQGDSAAYCALSIDGLALSAQ